MDVSCWIISASRAAVPTPRPSQNLCSTSWYTIAAVNRLFRRPATTLRRTSNSPIPWKSLLPFGINTTVYHVHSLYSFPSRNTACTMSTTFCHTYSVQLMLSIYRTQLFKKIIDIIQGLLDYIQYVMFFLIYLE